MELGIFASMSADSMSIIDLARAPEERRVGSLWLGEHTHVPVASEVDGDHGAAMLERTKGCPAAWVLLATAAAVTQRLRVGSSVCLVAQHDPLVLAKDLATLDVVSGGRVEFGCGYGWNRAEMRNHGITPETRRAVFREHLVALRRLWTDDVASYEGDHVRFSPSWSQPKPLQKPHPPVLLGAPARPGAIDDLVDLADGWMPSAYFALDTFEADLAAVRRAWHEAGRGPGDPLLTVLESRTASPGTTDREFVARQPPLDRLLRYTELGAQRVVIGVPVDEPSTTLRILDHAARLQGALA